MARAKATTTQAVRSKAADLFERQGYGNTSLDDIAEAVGVSKPTLYNYVGSKLELLEQIVTEVMETLDEGMRSILEGPGPAGERLRAALLFQARAAVEQRVYYQLFFAERPELSAAMQERMTDWARTVNHRFTALIVECRAEGVLAGDIDPGLASYLVLGMMNSVSRWYRRRDGITPEDIGEQAYRIIASRDVAEKPRGAGGRRAGPDVPGTPPSAS